MSFRRSKRMAMLVKAETTYGVDITPTAAEGIVAKNVSFTPIEATEVARDLALPYMGNQGTILTAEYGRIEFDVEIAGAGAAGTAPKWAALARIAGMAQTVTAGTSAVYSIVEQAVESGTLYFVHDLVRHIFVGGQANIALSFIPKQIPHFRVSFMGLLGTISDVASMPAVTLTGWTTPVAVSKANTTMTLHGWSAVAESLQLDLGNVLTPRHLIGDERIAITDRQGKGTAVVEARSLATIDWFERARAATRAGLTLTHGTTPGNIVEVTCPAVQIGKPTQGETDGILNYTLPLSLCPVSGRDEMTITVR